MASPHDKSLAEEKPVQGAVTRLVHACHGVDRHLQLGGRSTEQKTGSTENRFSTASHKTTPNITTAV